MAVVSLLAQVADLKASQVAGAASSVMPSGVILPYGGATVPAGWLECNGQAVSQAEYADLFASLGSSYNTQLNPTTGSNWAAPSAGQFRVPDMRGMFLRGEGTPSGLDAVSVGGSQVDKTKKNGFTASSAAIGGSDGTHAHTASSSSSSSSSTNDPTHAHDHGNASGGWAAGLARTGTFGMGGFVSGTWSDRYPDSRRDGLIFGNGLGLAVYTTTNTTTTVTTTNSGHGHTAPSITISSTDNETRPINRGVKYIIKA